MAGRMADNLLAWRIFQEMVSSGEISQTSRCLNIDSPKVSRLLAGLEKELGFALFDRTHRPFIVTNEGRRLLNVVQTLLETQTHLKNVCNRVSEKKQHVVIRLGVATGSDSSFLLSLLDEYSRIDDELEIHLIDHANLDDLNSGRIQIAYLPYLVKKQEYLCVPVTTTFTLSVASPRYLRESPPISIPEDLSSHTVILRSDHGYPIIHGLWKHQYYRALSAGKKLFLDNRLALQAALENKGIALDIPASMLMDHIKSCHLQSCMNGWHRQCWHYSLICHYDVLSEFSLIGNFLEWAALRLQDYENFQWQKLYEISETPFPIDCNGTLPNKNVS